MKHIIFHHIEKTAGTAVDYALRTPVRSSYYPQPDEERTGNQVCNQVDKRYMKHHGLFHPDLFTKPDDCFYFTWVRDPVDMVYSAWKFFNHVGVDGAAKRNRELLYHAIQHPSVEGYIDCCLEIPKPVFPEGVFTTLDFSVFDFVGSAARMQSGVRDVLRLSGCELPTTSIDIPTVNTSKDLQYTYRRDELAERLAPEIEAVRPYL